MYQLEVWPNWHALAAFIVVLGGFSSCCWSRHLDVYLRPSTIVYHVLTTGQTDREGNSAKLPSTLVESAIFHAWISIVIIMAGRSRQQQRFFLLLSPSPCVCVLTSTFAKMHWTRRKVSTSFPPLCVFLFCFHLIEEGQKSFSLSLPTFNMTSRPFFAVAHTLFQLRPRLHCFFTPFSTKLEKKVSAICDPQSYEWPDQQSWGEERRRRQQTFQSTICAVAIDTPQSDIEALLTHSQVTSELASSCFGLGLGWKRDLSL